MNAINNDEFREMFKKAFNEIKVNYLKKYGNSMQTQKDIIEGTFKIFQAMYLSIKSSDPGEADAFKAKYCQTIKKKLPNIFIVSFSVIVIKFILISLLFFFFNQVAFTYAATLTEFGKNYIFNVLMIIYGAAVYAFCKTDYNNVIDFYSWCDKQIYDFLKNEKPEGENK